MEERHLGSGVVASYEDDCVWVSFGPERVPLEPAVFEALLQYNRDLVAHLRINHEANLS